MGTRAFSIQYHVETTERTVREWGAVPAYGQALERALGTDALARFEADASAGMGGFNRNARRIYDNFMRGRQANRRRSDGGPGSARRVRRLNARRVRRLNARRVRRLNARRVRRLNARRVRRLNARRVVPRPARIGRAGRGRIAGAAANAARASAGLLVVPPAAAARGLFQRRSDLGKQDLRQRAA